MAPAAGTVDAATPAPHALTFRVMRLCRPSVVAERPLLLAPEDLGHPAEPPRAPGAAPDASAGFAHRFELAAPSDAAGLGGALLLPQSFGSIHLGESFACYVSVANFSGRAVSCVGLRAELQTDKTRAVLHDATAAPHGQLAPGERLDVLVEADVKAAGAHTLVCSAAYLDADGERRYLPQYFKFNAANPLAVRTKVRALPGGATLLEACVENLTKAPLYMESVRFDPAPGLTCRELSPDSALETGLPLPPSSAAAAAADDARAQQPSPQPLPPSPLAPLLARLALLAPAAAGGGGGARHWLFHLERPPPAPPSEDGTQRAAAPADASGALGRLDMRWRGPLGDGGRLQTQSIVASVPARRDVSITLTSAPAVAELEQPFTLLARVRNDGAVRTATLRLSAAVATLNVGSSSGGAPHSAGVVPQGPVAWALGELAPGASADVALRCVAVQRGVQRAPALHLAEDAPVAVGTARLLDATPTQELLVIGGPD